jgi:hypothetical protein
MLRGVTKTAFPHTAFRINIARQRTPMLYIFEWQAPFSLQRRGIPEVKRPADGWKWPNW